MQLIRNRSLSTKILAGNLLILALLLVVAVGAWLSNQALARQLAELDNHVNAMVHLSRAETALWELRWGLGQYIVTNAEERAKLRSDETKWYAQIDANMAAYAELSQSEKNRTEESQAALRAWEDSWPRYRDSRPTWFELFDAGKTEEAAAFRAANTTKFGRLAVAALNEMIAFKQAESDRLQAETGVIARNALLFQSAAGAVALLLGVGVALALARAISQPVRAITAVAREVAAGNLERSAPVESSDEIGELAGAFNQMTAGLRAQVEAQRQANDELRAAAATRMAKEELETAVQRYDSFAARVASGDFTARLDVGQDDGALGRLGRSLNIMVESLHSLTQQVTDATAAISAAAAQILSATTQMASAAAEQSSAVSATSGTLRDVKQIADRTAEQAAQVARDSQIALTAARQGSETVEETIGEMRQIEVQVQSIAQTILTLADQSQAIGKITATVAELADQSNLLALNAAIEAARAGEQGRSFAVVAQHVRQLAERSKAATAQVRDILGQIERATNAAVLVTDEGTRGVTKGLRQAGAAGAAIHTIADEIAGGAQANAQMAEGARQASGGIAMVGDTIGAIQRSAGETLTSTRQAERAARDLHELAQNLQSVVASFKV